MARQKPGRLWRVTGSVWKAGKRIKTVHRQVTADSEAVLDAKEKEVRRVLYEEIIAEFPRSELQSFRIEVDKELT
jgi:hypothetical protein